jgi:O6-methylguanine-DNA--protein-cysteine methyltransferase
LVDDRVRRIMDAQGSARSTMVPVEELRIIAQTRTARLGSFARYATSLLLLLAVLGTFAGVKTALPGLIEAVSASNQLGELGTSTNIMDPLRAVADAFGANALALIGAIAVGLMAHGIGVGRRNLLERLELVSAEYIYGSRQMDSTDPLRSAVDAMRDTVERVRETSGSLLGIESGLVALGQQFAEAFESLDERLTAIIEQQDERLHERTSYALEELRERVAEMTHVVAANTRAYAGLVDRIGERSEEAQRAIQQLETANRTLAAGLEGAANLSGVAQKAGEEVSTSIRHIEESTTQVRQQVEALNNAVGTVAPSLEQGREVLLATSRQITDLNERTTVALADLNDRAAASWVNAGRDMEQHIARLAAGNGRASAASGVGPDATQLLRQIAHSLDSRPSRLSTAHFVLLPALGVVLGGTMLYGLYLFSRSEIVAWLLALLRIG